MIQIIIIAVAGAWLIFVVIDMIIDYVRLKRRLKRDLDETREWLDRRRADEDEGAFRDQYEGRFL